MPLGTKDQAFCYRYWGKANPLTGDLSHHLLPYHGLDVAAVGLTLIQQQHRLRQLLSSVAGTDEPTLKRWLTFFLLTHDLGKFSNVFQRLRPDLVNARVTQDVALQPYRIRHDTLGFMLWKHTVYKQARELELLSGSPGADPYWPDYFEHWARATT